MRVLPFSSWCVPVLCLCACFGKTKDGSAVTPDASPLQGTPRLLWTSQWGTEGSDDLWAIEASPDGHIVVGGRSDGPIAGIPGLGSFDVFVAKLDGSSGERLWISTSGSTEWDDSPALTVDKSGDVFNVGFTQGDLHRENTSSVESFVEKRLGSTGELAWGVQFSGGPATRAYAVTASSRGSLFVVGTRDEQDPGGANTVQLFLRKLAAATGETIWEVQWGETNTQNYANSVQLLSEETLLVAGRTTGQNETGAQTRLFALALSQEDGSVIDSYWLDEGKHNLDAASAVGHQGQAFIAGELDLNASPDPLAPVQFVSALGWGAGTAWRREFTLKEFDFITALSHSNDDLLVVAGSAPTQAPGQLQAHSNFALMLLGSKSGEPLWSFAPSTGPESRARALSKIQNKAWSVGGDTRGSLYGPHLGSSDIFVAHFQIHTGPTPSP